MYLAALDDLDIAAACHYEATHGDATSAEAMAWSYIEAHARLGTIGLIEGLARK